MGEDTKLASMQAINVGQTYDPQKIQQLANALQRLFGSVRRMERMLVAGDAGQVLAKSSNKDFEGVWSEAGGGGSGDVTGAENIGHGLGLFTEKLDGLLRFKSLSVEGALEITEDESNIILTGTGGGGGVDPDDLADVAFSGEYSDLLHSPPKYKVQTEASREWLVSEFIRGLTIIGVRQAGATVLLPHDLPPERVVTIKDEVGGGYTLASY